VYQVGCVYYVARQCSLVHLLKVDNLGKYMLLAIRITCKTDLQVPYTYAAHFNVKAGSEFTDHCAIEGCESNNVRYIAVQIK
jgi:hypothetical protein